MTAVRRRRVIAPAPNALSQRARYRAVARRLRLVRWLAIAGVVTATLPYYELRGLADETALPRQELVASLEALAAGGTTPTEWLQQWFYSAGDFSWFDWVWLLVYAHWFTSATIGMIYVAGWHWDRFRALAVTWFVLFYGALIWFALVPTEPPWMVLDVTRVVHEAASVVKVDSNTVAALPSLHVGLPAMFALWAGSARLPRMAAAFWVFTALTAFSVVYFGEHYVLDCVAGVAWAWLAVRVAARWAPAAAAETPPAEAGQPPEAKRAA
jgi:hypothetical protein